MGRKPKTEFTEEAKSHLEGVVHALVRHYGGVSALGVVMGVPAGTISRWARGLRKPSPHYKGVLLSMNAQMLYQQAPK